MSEWRKQAITIIDDLILNHEIKSIFKSQFIIAKKNPHSPLLRRLNLFEDS